MSGFWKGMFLGTGCGHIAAIARSVRWGDLAIEDAVILTVAGWLCVIGAMLLWSLVSQIFRS
jgi:hypothetical protein